jgi:hypothetical protein
VANNPSDEIQALTAEDRLSLQQAMMGFMQLIQRANGGVVPEDGPTFVLCEQVINHFADRIKREPPFRETIAMCVGTALGDWLCESYQFEWAIQNSPAYGRGIVIMQEGDAIGPKGQQQVILSPIESVLKRLDEPVKTLKAGVIMPFLEGLMPHIEHLERTEDRKGGLFSN